MKKLDNKFETQVESLSNGDVINLLTTCFSILRKREVIRSKNITGDLGEYSIKEEYCNRPDLPNMELTCVGSSYIDALMDDKDTDSPKLKVSIKTLSGMMSSEFHGLEPRGSDKENNKLFDRLIINKINDNFEPILIIELTWEEFIKIKRWHTDHKAWVIRLNIETLNSGKIILDKRQIK